jgi:Reverse transcriptase (RNA-dependent DNA polymerase)
MRNLQTRQIDFLNAFVQSKLPKPIYLKPPPNRRYHQMYSNYKDRVLKVSKSLYGDKCAPKLWFQHLRNALLDMKFRQSQMDQCLFFHTDGTVFHTYVDDGIFYNKDADRITAHISDLQKRGFDIDIDESNLQGYLGIQKEVLPDGSFNLTQTGLINRVIEQCNLDENSTPRYTPAVEALGTDANGPPASGEFNYRSVGMIMFLANNTRPELALAVNQCARYNNNPKLSHEKAVKHIARYLLSSRTKGMIIKPSDKISLDCYVDADFAGLYTVEDHTDPRSGFVIMLSGVPLVWTSKVQTATATSTMMAEYVALSSTMKTLIPLRRTVAEILEVLKAPNEPLSKLHSTVWEDNMPALTLAKAELPRLTPGSKHFNVKYHWFRKHLKKGELEVHHISTKEQIADIFTKALP